MAPADASPDLLPQVELGMLAAVGVTVTAERGGCTPLNRACTHHLCAGGQRARAVLALHA